MGSMSGPEKGSRPFFRFETFGTDKRSCRPATGQTVYDPGHDFPAMPFATCWGGAAIPPAPPRRWQPCDRAQT